MPSLSDAIESGKSMDGYMAVEPVATESPGLPDVSANYDPGRNSMIRCPMPPLWSESSDSSRQFYLNGQIPQMRLMTPNSPLQNGSNTIVTTTNVSVSGGGSSGGGTKPTPSTIVAAQAVVTTPVLAPGLKFIGTVGITKSFQLLTMAVSSPCRVQIYGTSAAQVQDLGRALDQPPPAGTVQNLITDVVLDTAPLLWSFQNRIGANADTTQAAVAYVTITNLDAISDGIVLTLQYVPLENA